MSPRVRPRVVVIGGGFGGLYAARALRNAPVDVTVIDRTNHHTFQPLLYQVATATLAATDITAPIRWLLRGHRNATVLMAEVAAVDATGRAVVLADGSRVEYDFLVLASGARHSYFSHPEWEQVAPGLKSIDDALAIRYRFLSAFERAEYVSDEAERTRALTFVVVGGGPTGVELAGMFPAVARHAIAAEFRRADTSRVRVVLVEAGPRLLPAFPEALSERARQDLQELGVEVRLHTMVTEMGTHHVVAGGERIEADTIVWAAGNAASPLAATLGVPLDRAGRVIVAPDLSVPGHPELFVVGDLAAMTIDGVAVPGVAPAAMQSGRAAGRNILRQVERRPTATFRYLNKGDMATVGRHRAVALIGGRQLSGAVAWWAWLLIHIMYLAGFRNRLVVLIEWGYAYFTYRLGARLISTGRMPPSRTG